MLHWPQGREAGLHVCKKGMQHYLTVACTCVIELIRQCCVHRYQILHTAGLGTNFLLPVNEPNGFPIE